MQLIGSGKIDKSLLLLLSCKYLKMKTEIFNLITRAKVTASGRPAVILSGGFVLMGAISIIGIIWHGKKLTHIKKID